MVCVEGCLSCHPSDINSVEDVALSRRLAMICGTSTCHITVSDDQQSSIVSYINNMLTVDQCL